MQVARRRPEAPDKACRTASIGDDSSRAAGDDAGLLDALPIAAGMFGIKRGKLWVHSLNQKFHQLAGCNGAPDQLKAYFDYYAVGEGGEFLRAFLADPGSARDEIDYSDGDGVTRRHFRLKLAPLKPDADGARCLLSVVDRTAEEQAQRSMRAEMLRDSLTGLPNRLSFADSIERAGEAAGHSAAAAGPTAAASAAATPSHAVLVVDMCRFSRINESMGALAGDELIITFARRLISALRGGDLLARTGGNEFGVLVSLRNGVDDALAAAKRIQQVTSAPFRLSELEIRVECAIGMALMSDGRESEELFRNAQFAVKQAKAAGEPQIYEPGQAHLARRRFSIETELRRALERDQLDMFYQPLVDLRSGAVTGFEALARWTHDDRGEISPSEFIPVAEESGLILTLGRWAMDKAMAMLASWDERAGAPLPIYVAVNMSAIQVARDDVAAMVGEALRSHALAGQRLTLELTESAIVQDPVRAERVFDALKALDATVAMDDFGTGYSSLAYLQRLPIDVLKIDRSFVTGMMGDADSVAIVRAVLGLAEALGMSTIAEGIETVELATTLAALGCASGQGYYFARPLPAADAYDFIETSRRATPRRKPRTN